MGKRADLGQIVKYEDVVMEVIAIGHGRSVILRPINASPCRECGSLGDVHLLEQSRLFQDNVHPVKTVDDA